MKQASRHTLKEQMIDSSSSRCEEVAPPRSSVWGSPSPSGRVGKCHKLPALIHGFHSGDQSLCPVADCFSLLLFPFLHTIFLSTFSVAVLVRRRHRKYSVGFRYRNHLDPRATSAWLCSGQNRTVLGFETHPEFLDESRRRVRSPTCLQYPAVK